MQERPNKIQILLTGVFMVLFLLRKPPWLEVLHCNSHKRFMAADLLLSSILPLSRGL
jgi:hypothetical protein